MKLASKYVGFLAFTAAFAVLAGFVFWGTWSPDYAPVMPDHGVIWPSDWIASFCRGWLTDGKFAPDDLRVFLGSPYYWQELKFAFALWCAGLGVAYLCRGRGLSLLASYGSGLLIAFCGYWSTLFSAGHFGWFQWMTYGVFAFGLADRAVRKGKIKNWILLGAVLAWGSMHQPDLWLIFTVFTAVWFVFVTATQVIALPSVERTAFWKRWLVGGVFAALTMVTIGAASFRHAFVNDLAGRDAQIARGETVGGNAADEAEKRWIFTTNWSLPPNETAEFWHRRLYGDTSCPLTLSLGRKSTGVKQYTGALGRPKDAPSGNYRQHSLYVGFLTCLAALVAVVFAVRGERRKDVAFFSVCAVVFWLFSLGRNCEMVYRIVYALPFGDYLRAPVKWHHLTELCLAVLAAYGLEAVRQKLTQYGKGIALGAVIAIVAIGAIDLASADHLYCAPQNITQARKRGMDMNLTVIPRAQLQHPQLQEMTKRGELVVQGSYFADSNAAVVGVLRPRQPEAPVKATPITLALGIISLIGTLFASVIGVFKS